MVIQLHRFVHEEARVGEICVAPVQIPPMFFGDVSAYASLLGEELQILGLGQSLRGHGR